MRSEQNGPPPQVPQPQCHVRSSSYVGQRPDPPARASKSRWSARQQLNPLIKRKFRRGSVFLPAADPADAIEFVEIIDAEGAEAETRVQQKII
jgi:hypothetical protein